MNLNRVATRRVVRAPRSCCLQDAAELMRRTHVGAVVVTNDPPDEHRVLGIATDRDIVLKAVAPGIAPRDATLEDVMTEGFITVKHSSDVRAVLETMRNHGVRRVGIVDEQGVVLGLVAFDDLLVGLAGEFADLAGVIGTEQLREAEEDTTT